MRGVFGGLVSFFLLLSFIFAVEELPVSIRGDHLSYQGALISASGNASILYDSYELRAEQITIDTDNNLIHGVGQVMIYQGTSSLAGEEFTFNINNDQFELNGISSSFKPALARQDIFIDIKTVKNYPGGAENADILAGQRSRLTTCDLEQPHYWVSAREFIYYPRKKVVAYHPTLHFWFSPIPLGYLPYYVFYTDQRRVILKPPIIGGNSTEGNFIKTETLYFIDQDNEGSVFIDAMSIKGNGKGFLHKYNYGNPGSIYYYDVLEQDTKPKRNATIIKFQQEYSPSIHSKFLLNHNYRKTYLLPTGYDDRLEDRLSYTYSDGRDQANFNYGFLDNYQADYEKQTFNGSGRSEKNDTVISWQKDYNRKTTARSEALNINNTYRFNNEWTYNVNPVYKSKQTAVNAADERLDLSMDLTLTPEEKKTFESMQIHYNWYIDTDSDRVTVDTLRDEFVEKVPEVTLKAHRLAILPITGNIALLQLDPVFKTAFIRESKYFASYNARRFFETEKYTADLKFWQELHSRPLSTTFRLERTYTQVGYGTGDSNYLLSDKPAARTDLFGFLRNSLEYEDTRGEGNSPFFFDAVETFANRTGTHKVALYHRKKFEALLTMSKDLNDYTYKDDLYNLFWDPRENRTIRFDLSSGKSRYSGLYRDLVAGFYLKPQEKTAFRFNMIKDINNNHEENLYAGKLKSAASEVNVALGKTYEELGFWNFWQTEWNFIIKNQYDFTTEYFNLVSFGLAKDLHCWKMRYNFTPVRKEWYIVFTLKAFPQEPLNVGGNEDTNVGFHAFEETVNATEVTRY